MAPNLLLNDKTVDHGDSCKLFLMILSLSSTWEWIHGVLTPTSSHSLMGSIRTRGQEVLVHFIAPQLLIIALVVKRSNWFAKIKMLKLVAWRKHSWIYLFPLISNCPCHSHPSRTKYKFHAHLHASWSSIKWKTLTHLTETAQPLP